MTKNLGNINFRFIPYFLFRELNLICFLSFISISALCQTYIPFPDSNAVWKVDHFNNPLQCPPSGFCGNFQYGYFGDTLINGIIYKKLAYCANVQSCYLGALRQDKQNKKIYFIIDGLMQEELLYDFSLTIGDTLPVNYVSVYDTCYVISQDSIQLANVYHKTLLCNCPSSAFNQVTLIEGIGSNFGLIEGFVIFEPWSSLNCFSGDNGLIYIDTTQFTNCNDLTSLSPLNLDKKHLLEIFPNPAEFNQTININFSQNIKYTLNIYNEFGQLIKSEEIDSLTKPFDINTSELGKGIFIINIVTNFDNYQSHKLLIY